MIVSLKHTISRYHFPSVGNDIIRQSSLPIVTLVPNNMVVIPSIRVRNSLDPRATIIQIPDLTSHDDCQKTSQQPTYFQLICSHNIVYYMALQGGKSKPLSIQKIMSRGSDFVPVPGCPNFPQLCVA